MDRAGRLAPGAHGQDDRGGPGGDIAAGPHALMRGLAGLLIDNDIALFTDGNPWCGGRDQRVRAVADGMDDAVEGQDKIGKTMLINTGFGEDAQVLINLDENKEKIRSINFLGNNKIAGFTVQIGD